MDDCIGPENRLSEKSGTRVRIPSSVPIIFRYGAMVAQLPVKEMVVGSNPTIGANMEDVA